MKEITSPFINKKLKLKTSMNEIDLAKKMFFEFSQFQPENYHHILIFDTLDNPLNEDIINSIIKLNNSISIQRFDVIPTKEEFQTIFENCYYGINSTKNNERLNTQIDLYTKYPNKLPQPDYLLDYSLYLQILVISKGTALLNDFSKDLTFNSLFHIVVIK